MAPDPERDRELEGLRAERGRTERELRRVNRALLVLSECNQTLVRAVTEPALLGDVCRILVDHGAYRMAWVGYVEPPPEKTVRPVARAGYDTGYLEHAHIGWGDDERGHGPSGEAIRTGATQVNRDFRTNPAMAPWRADATLPIQGLKIDRSFVSGMLASASVRSVVEATISLARALQIGVVAEGVETQDQADALAAMGCDEIQGFLVGRPMGADEFEQWAAARGRRECDD